MARSAKDWRVKAIVEAETAEALIASGMNLDGEMHAQLSQAASLISIAISVAKPERKPDARR